MLMILSRCRLRLWTAVGSIALAALACPPAHAQAAPSAFGPGSSLWAGGEYSNINASFPYGSGERLWGMGGFLDYNRAAHLTLEAEARFLRFNGYHGEAEDSFLAGPRYRFRRLGKFQPYGQFLAGLAHIRFPYQIGTMNYLALAPGAGVNYAVSRRLLLRAEYELQIWPNSPNLFNEPGHELRPRGFHVGIAYRVLR